MSYDAVIPSRASGEIINSHPTSPRPPGPFSPQHDLQAYNSEAGLLRISHNSNIFLKQHQAFSLPRSSSSALWWLVAQVGSWAEFPELVGNLSPA